ncbi:MAG: endolytic transglycosylase MltG [Candidatus Firestonebacteria bacterium]
MKKYKKEFEKKKHCIAFITQRNFVMLAMVAILVVPFLPAGFGSKEKFINIQKGYGASKISYMLKKEGIIRSRIVFRFLSFIRGGHLKAGEYKLSSSMLTWNIITMMKAGKVAGHPVTVPEGFMVRQIARLFEDKGLAAGKRIEKLCSDKEFIKKCGIDASGLEGYLFPSTYFITRDMSEEEILLMMTREFKEVWKKNGFDKVIAAKKEKLNDVIKLASMVEREAETAYDRPLIAGVFTNRLKKNMKLESCATIVYALGEKEMHKERLTGKDLMIESPYNTYIYQGLPPGPICSPGVASIKAAIFPADTKMLFFVLKQDGSHSHTFSETKQQHEKAKKEEAGVEKKNK